jgi:hypothetical protein
MAGVLSFASPKESSQRKGDPRVGALRVPCATRQSGRLSKLACGSDNASRRPPDSLRCSAPLMGTRKASRGDGSAQEEQRSVFYGLLQEKPKIVSTGSAETPFPLGRCRATQKCRGFRLALSEPQASLASRPAFRVAQGTRRAPTQGRLFFAYFLLAKQKKVRRPTRAEPSTQRRHQPKNRRGRTELKNETTPRYAQPCPSFQG